MKTQKTQARLGSFIIIIAIALLAGCSGPPSESTGRAALQKKIENQSKGKIQLVSFRKTNGAGDDSYYTLEYEAEIQFLATGTWVSGGRLDPRPLFGFSGKQNFGMASYDGAMNVQQGQHATVKGALQFEKTEKGWRDVDWEATNVFF